MTKSKEIVFFEIEGLKALCKKHKTENMTLITSWQNDEGETVIEKESAAIENIERLCARLGAESDKEIQDACDYWKIIVKVKNGRNIEYTNLAYYLIIQEETKAPLELNEINLLYFYHKDKPSLRGKVEWVDVESKLIKLSICENPITTVELMDYLRLNAFCDTATHKNYKIKTTRRIERIKSK
jgi:hypothetical protein